MTPAEWDDFRKSEGIHPDVWSASLDELIAAGWKDYPRRRIPSDWRTRKPLASNHKGGRRREYSSQAEYRAKNKEKINAQRRQRNAAKKTRLRSVTIQGKAHAVRKAAWMRNKRASATA